MSIFDRIASGYDLAMLPLELLFLRRLRRRIYPHVEGRILELGLGTGVNLPYYDAPAELIGLDLSASMLASACHRPSRARVRCVQGDAEALPFRSGVFDYVTTSLVFCSVGSPAESLREIARVLRPGGWLMALEHVRGHGLGRRLTDALAGPWLRVTESCHLDRETEAVIAASPLVLVCTTRHTLGVLQILIAHKR